LGLLAAFGVVLTTRSRTHVGCGRKRGPSREISCSRWSSRRVPRRARIEISCSRWSSRRVPRRARSEISYSRGYSGGIRRRARGEISYPLGLLAGFGVELTARSRTHVGLWPQTRS
jgi:hypothetical protein